MAIPESQLETWSHQGSITQSSDTYATVRRSLEAPTTAYAKRGFKVFLQGSYGNDTNIYAESDVDVVIRLDDTFYYDSSALTAEEQAALHAAFDGTARYSYSDFKKDVVAALQASFSSDVNAGKKAVVIAASSSRRKSDVIVATEFRRYRSYTVSRPNDYASGICFFTNAGDRVANYPKQHAENLTEKHQVGNQWLKPTIRILKNMRGRMEADGLLAAGVAPSYFLEGLLYNVPNGKFGSSYERTLVEVINWLTAVDRTPFVCANEEYYLLRDVAHVCWRPADCDTFLAALVKFWKDWA